MADISTDYSDKKIIILLEDVDLMALHALNCAKEMSKDIVAFSTITMQDKEEELRAKWDKTGGGIPFIIRYSQYKGTGTLLTEFIDSLGSDKDVAVLVPLAVMKSWWQRYLNRSYIKHLKHSFIDKENIVLVEIPYYIGKAA